MGTFELKSFIGGISDWENKGTVGAFKFGSNLNIRKMVDSLSCNQALVDEGLHNGHSSSASPSPSTSVSASPSRSLSPSPSPTPSPSASQSPSTSFSRSPSRSPSFSPSPSGGVSTTVFEDLILWFVPASDGYMYGFGDRGHVYRRDSDGFWQHMFRDPDGRIKGACEAYTDPEHGSKIYLVWTTDTKVNRKELPGRNDWGDVNASTAISQWPKIDLQSADWHTAKNVAGSTHIANGSFLAFIGFDGSYTDDALNLIPGNVAKTIVERGGRSVIGTVRKFGGKGVNAAIDAERPLAQVGNDGELFFANMVDSVSVKRFPGGGKANPGGVVNEIEQMNFFEWEEDALSWLDKQSVGNLALFGIYGAASGKNGIWSFGRKNKNAHEVMNLEYALDVDEIGALGNANGTILASYRLGGTVGVKAVDPTTKATAIYEGLDLSAPLKKPGEITNWPMVRMITDPLPAGCAIQFWFKTNKTGPFRQARTADNQAQYVKTGSREPIFNLGTKGDIFEPRAVLIPNGNNGPEIHKMFISVE